jgi:hypothetical protein
MQMPACETSSAALALNRAFAHSHEFLLESPRKLSTASSIGGAAYPASESLSASVSRQSDGADASDPRGRDGNLPACESSSAALAVTRAFAHSDEVFFSRIRHESSHRGDHRRRGIAARESLSLSAPEPSSIDATTSSQEHDSQEYAPTPTWARR